MVSMNSKQRAAVSTVTGVMIAVSFWGAACPRVSAQQAGGTAAPEVRASGERGVIRTLAEAMRAASTPLRLTKMDNVGARGWHGFRGEEPRSLREQFAVDSAAQAFLDRLTRPGSRTNGFVRAARATLRLADAPNRALCRFTGADRARLDLRKRRVSFTWLVSW